MIGGNYGEGEFRELAALLVCVLWLGSESHILSKQMRSDVVLLAWIVVCSQAGKFCPPFFSPVRLVLHFF